MNRTLEQILPKVQKPARYTGGEYNAVDKDRGEVDVRYALCSRTPMRAACPIWAAAFYTA